MMAQNGQGGYPEEDLGAILDTRAACCRRAVMSASHETVHRKRTMQTRRQSEGGSADEPRTGLEVSPV